MRFCYWTIADGDHSLLAKAMVKSARAAGVTEDIHVWTDVPEIEGATVHDCGIFSHENYLFKFQFLRDHVSKLDYDFFVFLDADCFFVRKPPPWEKLLRMNKWFVQMENDATSVYVKRDLWWGCKIPFYIQTLKYCGVKSKKIWNTNAGMFIVRKEAIHEFCEKAIEFWEYCHKELRLNEFTEEPALAYVGHFVDNPELNTLSATSKWWATEWCSHFNDFRLPDGNPWPFEDYLTSERKNINPAIVHVLRAKSAMRLYAQGLPLPIRPDLKMPVVPPTPPIRLTDMFVGPGVNIQETKPPLANDLQAINAMANMEASQEENKDHTPPDRAGNSVDKCLLAAYKKTLIPVDPAYGGPEIGPEGTKS